MLKKIAALLVICATGMHVAAAQQTPAPAAAGGGGGGFAGSPGLPGNLFNSAHKLEQSTLRREWVHIPMGRGSLRTLIVHPEGTAQAPVVLVLHYDAGLDYSQQALALQLAERGFIAVAPDLLSGLGPERGSFDSFRFPDAALRGVLSIKAPEAMRRYKTAFGYAKALPRANGRISALGVSIGGTHAFRLASEVPELRAAVVFYGLPPDKGALGKIKAPVLGLYGGEDTEVVATVAPTTETMRQLGKVYESQIYPGATHSFLSYVVEARNGEALTSGWTAAVAFLNQHGRN